MEETLKKVEETLAAFEGGRPDPEKDPQAAEIFDGLYLEMLRLRDNLERLRKNLGDYRPNKNGRTNR